MSQTPAPTAQPGFDVIVTMQQDDAHNLTFTAHYQGETYSPETIKTHAALHALNEAWADIVASVNGRFTDADRFRGLMEFSMLGQHESTRERFDKINTMIQQVENDQGMTDGARTPEEFRQMADFILHALIETRPTPAVGAE